MTKIEKIREAMAAYREEWELTHPAPEQGKVRAMDFLQFYLFLPVALLGPLVSSFRTAALLTETAAFPMNRTLVLLEALLGTAFFELGAIVYQVIRLRRKSQEEGGLPRVGTAWIVFGMIITIGAVTTSNFVEVLIAALIKADSNFIPPYVTAILIGIFIGPGVAACTVIAGEVVGRFLLEWQVANSEIDNVYQESLAKWEKSFISSWNGRKGREFLESYLQKPKEESIQEERVRPRSEYSHWPNRRARLEEIARYVNDHDPEHVGVEITEIWANVWNGRAGSDSTKYADIKRLIDENVLEKTQGPDNGRRVRLLVSDKDAEPF